jgi:flagellar basal-body rod protein FlgB
MSLGSERFKFEIKNSRDMYETAPSGNAVILEQQLIKNAETVTDYQLMTNLYRKHVSMFKMALGGGKGQ